MRKAKALTCKLKIYGLLWMDTKSWVNILSTRLGKPVAIPGQIFREDRFSSDTISKQLVVMGFVSHISGHSVRQPVILLL